MHTSVDLLDLAKQRLARSHALPEPMSDYRFEKLTGVKQATVSNWRSGRAHIGTDFVPRFAEWTGLSPAYVLACTQYERASDASVRQILTDIAKAFEGQSAAAVIMCIGAAILAAGTFFDVASTSTAYAFFMAPNNTYYAYLGVCLMVAGGLTLYASGERHHAGTLAYYLRPANRSCSRGRLCGRLLLRAEARALARPARGGEARAAHALSMLTDSRDPLATVKSVTERDRERGQTGRMNALTKGFTVFPVMALLTGCTAIQERWDGLTPRQRSVATFVGAVLVVGAIKAHEFDNGDSGPATGSPAPMIPTPDVDCTTHPALCR